MAHIYRTTIWLDGPAKEHFKTGLCYIETEEKEPHNILIDRVSKQYIEDRFYNITCSNINFVNNLGLSKDMLLNGMKENKNDSSMTSIERNFLFNFVKKIMPRKVMEFSPFRGFSTAVIVSSLKEINICPDFFETHEVDKENVKLTNFYLHENNIDFVKVVEGDVLQTIDKEKLKETDFLLIDSDHSDEFAKNYIKQFFPLLKNGCWVAIHDISHDKHFCSGEARELLTYFKENNIFTYFHVADLMKIFQVVGDDFIYSNARNTLLFWQVSK